jgi:glycerophosphoryl diester phosphodiesterase
MVCHLIHRGLAKHNFKENTLTSFKYCFNKNYGIETDLHCTKDNKIICFHDFNLKSKFKFNKYINKINYSDLYKISRKGKIPIPLLKDLIEISKKKHYLMLEIKPLFSTLNLNKLIYETKKLKKYSITSFKEKNLTNLYKINKSLNLGLVVPSTWSIDKIKKKSKLKHIKFLVLEKKFLTTKKLDEINKNVFYYTIKQKKIFDKYRYKNLIFENF